MKSKDGTGYPVRKVEYVEEYALSLEGLVDSNNEIPQYLIHDKLFYRKTSRWQHEYEYRMVRPLEDSPDYKGPKANVAHIDTEVYRFPFDWDCISSVIVGANMSVENKKFIADKCKKYHKPLFLAHIVRDVKDYAGKPGTIYISNLTNYSDPDLVLKSMPQIFCSDTIKFANGGIKNISRLEELPYYSSYPEDVIRWYHIWSSDDSDAMPRQ